MNTQKQNNELACVLINPYTLYKSRTGGVIARYQSRTGLRLAGTRMLELTPQLAEALAACATQSGLCQDGLLSDYIRRNYTPGPRHRTLILLFEGPDAISRVKAVTGTPLQSGLEGLTVRDTFGDLVRDETGRIIHFEPAVICGSTPQNTAALLATLGPFIEASSPIIPRTEAPESLQRSLVILKPDNWNKPSLRAGTIIDLLSSAGLRIIGMKKFAMSPAQAQTFYAPVREALTNLFPRLYTERLTQLAVAEWGFTPTPEQSAQACKALAPAFGDSEFKKIIHFMTGRHPDSCPPEFLDCEGLNESLAIVYEGVDAISRIREILGATDPAKARPGSIRSEFGSTVMINAAHASDSPENAQREMQIIQTASDAPFRALIRNHHS